MSNTKIGIIGVGFVGTAIMESFIGKGYVLNKDLHVYDKYKEQYKTNFDDLLQTTILFLALPTLYNFDENKYDTTGLEETIATLYEKNYDGLILIKSTVEPTTTQYLYNKYKMHIIHNPEFLTARTALYDFNNQKHIIIGIIAEHNYKHLYSVLFFFYKRYFPDAIISVCSTTESEMVKICLNSYYAVKVQYFTEIYLLCDKLNIDYDSVKNLMLKNGWINPMHTTVPGPDGQLSYGGMCFPKDTNALCNFMDKVGVNGGVLRATINERNIMRND